MNFHLYSKEQYSLFNEVYKNKNTFLAPQCLKDFGNSNTHPPKEFINFLFFGIIRENKGLEHLILAANKLASSYKGKFKVSIAGSCDNWGKYSSLIECMDVFELDIHVIMNEKIPDYFKSAHYLILPYIDVTQSGVLFIAYNYGTPVIASNHSWFKNYIKDCENGYLFENGSVESLYKIMEKIILSKNKEYYSLKSNLTRFINTTISHQAIVDEYIKYFNAF
jgi:glycosyltransferase involved in cell wall biosynthesis